MSVGYTFLVYGDGGTWKSWTALTGPGRKLLIDFENRADNLPGEVVYWDGKGKFPECGADATVVITITTTDQFATIVNAVCSGKLPVQTVVVDSVSVMQQNEIDTKFPGGMQKQHWGALLKVTAPPLRQLMVHAKKVGTELECVVLIAWHKEYAVTVNGTQENRIKPFVDGQLQQRLSHLTDVVGYMTVERKGNEKFSKMQIEPTNGVTAKSTYSTLDHHNGFIKNPKLVSLITEMQNKKENSDV